MYDAIVVGARCAGSPTVMLCPRAGHPALPVDRAAFPSDALSTHYIRQSGVARLKRLGLLNRIAAAGAPPIRNYTLDAGPFALRGGPPPLDGVRYSLWRTILDQILVEAAAEAHEHTPVEEIVIDQGQVSGIRSRGVIERNANRDRRRRLGFGSGAPRRRSALHHQGTWTCAYYTHWTGVEMDGVEPYPRLAGRSWPRQRMAVR